MSDHVPSSHPDGPVHGHEMTDISVGAVMWFLAGLAVVLVLTGAFLWWLFGFMQLRAERGDPRPSPVASSADPPQPRLQRSPSTEMQELRAREAAHLRAYGWSSREQRTVHIPIDEAINRVVRGGLPKWPSVEPTSQEGAP